MDKVIIVIDEKIAGRSKKMKKAIECLAFNPMCYDCKNFKNGCTGETNKIYSNCVYKERDGKKEDIYMLIRKAIFN